MEPPFCSQFICDTGVTHKLKAIIKIFTNLKSWEREYGDGEENMGEEKEKRGEGKRRSGSENDRSSGGEEGVIRDDAGSGIPNPGRKRGGKVDRRSVGEDNEEKKDRGIGGEETRR